jgi:FlaG/FlaF family flagellin (archaellin)
MSTEQGSSPGISSTVSRVIDAFVSEVRGDADLDAGAADGLERLLRQGLVPKSEDWAATILGVTGDEP